MPTAYRVTKARHAVFDPDGAFRVGGRWSSPGRRAIYTSACLAGSLLEILARAGTRKKLPGRHHCAVAHIPEDLEIEVVDESALDGWDRAGSPVARERGDRWLAEARTAVLDVPALTARPFGRHLVINPDHPDFGRILLGEPVPIFWDARLFQV